MKKLQLEQLETMMGGCGKNHDYYTGLVCTGTVILAFSGFLAPLAGATGAACLVMAGACYGH